MLTRLLDDTEMPKEEYFFAALGISTCVIFVVRPKKLMIYTSQPRKSSHTTDKKNSPYLCQLQKQLYLSSPLCTSERTKNSDVALRSLFPPPMVTSLSCESQSIAVGTNKQAESACMTPIIVKQSTHWHRYHHGLPRIGYKTHNECE